MKKAYLFLSTFLVGLTQPDLPEINIPANQPGKIIKARQLSSPVLTKDYRIKTVIIDPGHGGHDPGCSGKDSKEKHLCLAIGKFLAEGLKNNYPDLKVIMTRSSDHFVTLDERAAIATRNNADLFISIHCNFIPKASHVQGTETYVLGLHATKENLEVAKRENASILLEENYKETYGYDPDSPEAHIMFSMFQNAFLEQSILFAQKVQNRSAQEAGRKDRGVKQAGFLVLRHATMPSVLVETGFLSNRSEELYLQTTNGQKAMANALLLAFHDYKKDMETGNLATNSIVPVKLKANSEEIVPADVPVVAAPLEVNNPAPKEEPKIVTVRQETVSAKPPDTKEPEKKTQADVASVNKPAENTTAIIIPSKPVSESPPPPVKELSPPAGAQYRVQLAASPSLLDVTTGKWAKCEYLIEVVEEDRLYKYQVRNFATLDEADQVRRKLRAVGFNDAFVVAYQNGKRVKIH
jgi:N-acetylmuramoyl-L-alanine amidase